MKAIVCVLVFFFTLGCFAQQVSGYVYDSKENFPLEGAFVYIDGTTYAVSTDARGFFMLTMPEKINAPLVVSYVGYELFRVENPFSYDKPIKIMLKENIITLDEVVINKGRELFSRKQMLKAFRKHFLGTSKYAKSCRIENEDAIKIYYDAGTNQLKAWSASPLLIVNKQLQYNIMFDLTEFTLNYNTTTLSDAYLKSSFFAGGTFFTDISGGKPPIRKRNTAYTGSQVHFMKTVASGNWENEKYQLYIDKFPVYPANYFKVKDTLDYKKVSLVLPEKKSNIVMAGGRQLPVNKFATTRYTILRDKKEQSFIICGNGYFYIDKDGLFFPIDGVVFGGYLGELKVGDMLPANFSYKE
jgi:hypothetical protein